MPLWLLEVCCCPSCVCFQQGALCQASFEPMERGRVKLRSRGKFQSLTKEWRGGSACFKVHVLPKSPLMELLYRVLISGERRGMEFLLVIAPDCIAPGTASLHMSCHHHLELSCCAVFMHIAPELKCKGQPLPTRNSGVKFWVQGLHTWYPVIK